MGALPAGNPLAGVGVSGMKAWLAHRPRACLGLVRVTVEKRGMLRMGAVCAAVLLVSATVQGQDYKVDFGAQKFCVFHSELFSVGAEICATRAILLVCTKDGNWEDAKSSPDPAACPEPPRVPDTYPR